LLPFTAQTMIAALLSIERVGDFRFRFERFDAARYARIEPGEKMQRETTLIP
jgi:hypothetical protein